MFADAERRGKVFTGRKAGSIISRGIVIEADDRSAIGLEGTRKEGERET